MTKLSDIEIKNKLKPIEDKIKFRKDFTRTDIQNALDEIYGQGLSPDSKKEILKSLIERTGVEIVGIKTIAAPKKGLEEEGKSYRLEGKTYRFLEDIYSYKGVIEGDNGKEGKET